MAVRNAFLPGVVKTRPTVCTYQAKPYTVESSAAAFRYPRSIQRERRFHVIASMMEAPVRKRVAISQAGETSAVMSFIITKEDPQMRVAPMSIKRYFIKPLRYSTVP